MELDLGFVAVSCLDFLEEAGLCVQTCDFILIKEVGRHPEVLECFTTSGEADFHLRVVVEDMDAYNKFLDDFICRLPGVTQVRSNIVLKEIKVDMALPFKT